MQENSGSHYCAPRHVFVFDVHCAATEWITV